MKLSSFPPGWVLGFLVDETEEGDKQVAFLPIVGMEVREDGHRGIATVVAMPTGKLLRDYEVEHEVVCIVGPGEDQQRATRAALAAREARQRRPGGGAAA